MLFSRIVCDATSIQGATDSVENFPLLDILEASKAGDDQREVLPFIPKEPYDVIACDCKCYHFYRFAREFLILVLKTQRCTNLTWWNLDMWSKQNHWHPIRLDSRLTAMMLMFGMWKA
ncbi:hypothetical protein Pyn_20923 [Prunus yedoensis var. nudiflora]|uniref:Uncharacterized protein n=1 Tax=Prunus yedoensis var. nudiflora TaxID=2094558 RepID=A0A314XWX8_PRUYE|nr:hypothetical protein Pyn_20923 [Prunus yedoensis var. nudiflora]